MSLEERLGKIKSPKLQNQRETAVVLSAIEDTLRDQKHEFTPTAYFAALLALLSQAISASNGIINKELATSVVYLLDIVTSHVPAPLLRSKFSQILTSIAPALTHQDADAPLLRPAIGCLESLLIVQDAASWALSSTQIGPRRAVAGLLTLSMEHRPKIRKRAQEALTKVLRNPPPSPSLDHPVADLCAETALHSLREIVQASVEKKNHKGRTLNGDEHHPGLIHSLQLVKTISAASRGWPSKRIDALCESLLEIAKSSNEYLTMASFEVFETVFAGMADETASAKLPRLMEAITELRPSQNDSQLLPPWIAVLSRGYDVSAQLSPGDTFLKVPELFDMISDYLASMSHNIRISASECLISFTSTCIPPNVILEPSIYDEKVLEKIGKTATGLLSVRYQAAWMEVFNVLSALFEVLRWRSVPLLNDVVKAVGELRGNDSFNGKKEADALLGKAIEAMGPEAVLSILPLNLAQPKVGQPGRAWMLPILRDNIINSNIAHFKSEFVPLSEVMFQRVIDFGDTEKTMEIKIFETIVSQIWALLPGYCTLPSDLVEAFDQSFAELVSNLLYKQTELRVDLCKALQLAVETNKEIASVKPGEEDLLLQRRVTAEMAKRNLEHLSAFAGNLLAVLFNVYSQTLPQYRGHILQCINSYLSITPEKELMETFTRVIAMLEAALAEATSQTQADKQKEKPSADKMPPTSHTLMDLVITISVYLPPSSFPILFSMAALILPQSSDPQLQKKAYKLLPRLANSEAGAAALRERSAELQATLLSSASSATPPARHDRLSAIAVVVAHMPSTTLHFIPSVLSEVVMAAKEVNEKARTSAFDLLVLMGKKMAEGGAIEQSRIAHMPENAPVTDATLEEYFTMVSAGLAGTTPHMISASITALTRILYEFRADLADRVLEDLVSTMDLFLTSNNLEIVRSVLGFVKVATTSLPDPIVQPRLESLVKGLMGWSHEHKARFRSKVKHIFERLIRRFGFEAIDRHCPEADKKLLTNIRKTKERAKRKKDATTTTTPTANGNQQATRHSKFASEFDEAVYGSEDGSSSEEEDAETQSNASNDESLERGAGQSTARHSRKRASKTYIVEDADEPLDLLDRRALGHISSTRPVRLRAAPSSTTLRSKARVNLDGKLILGGAGTDENGDAEMADPAGGGGGGGGIGAYVDAVRGRDAVQRGRGGRLKFSNRRTRGDDNDEDDADAMDVDGGDEEGRRRRGEGGEARADKGNARRGGQRGKSVRFGKVETQRGGFGRGGAARKGLDGRKGGSGRGGAGGGAGGGGGSRGGGRVSKGAPGRSEGRGRGRGRGGARGARRN